MEPSTYLDLSRPGEPRERTAYFVLDSLLRSRIECGFESNSLRHDEEVNVYLVDLLSRLVESPAVGTLARPREIDVFEQVRGSADPRFKSAVYRTNADHCLVSTSLFVQTPYVERDGRRRFEGGALDRIGRGKAYYRFAARFLDRVPSGSPAFARVLEFLSEDFERYVEVLFHMRGEYFHLYERLRSEELAALDPASTGCADAAMTDAPAPVLRDEFLDAYWAWHQCPDAANRARLESAVRRLKAADRDFRFDLDLPH